MEDLSLPEGLPLLAPLESQEPVHPLTVEGSLDHGEHETFGL